MKKKIFIAAAIVIVLSLFAFGTLAFFTTSAKATNIITTGKLSMELHEETDDGEPFPEDGIKGVLPGQSVTKKVYVENTGKNEMYVRVSVEIKAEDQRGEMLPADLVALNDLDTENWTKKTVEGVDYYYYNKPLQAGESTSMLFRSVGFSGEMGNAYSGSTIYVIVNADGTQVANNGSSAVDALY